MSTGNQPSKPRPPWAEGCGPNAASETRYQRTLADMRAYNLAEHPTIQAEIIARHYTSLATTALNLLQLIEARRYSENPEPLDQCIDFCLRQIKDLHWQDLGIKLEWPTRDA